MKTLKKNGTQWIVLASTFLIWGAIAVRVIGLTGSGIKTEIPVMEPRTSPLGTEVALLLNYRDPFLGHGSARPVSRGRLPGKKRELLQQVESPPGFRLLGKIKKGKKDFLLVASGEERRIVAVTDKIDGFLVCSVFADSVVVRKGSKQYTVIMENE